MPERDQLVTQTLGVSEVRRQWGQLLDKVSRGETRVIVERRDVPIAALISPEDLERLTRLEEERAERFRALAESWAAFEGVPAAELEHGVLNAVERARQKYRRQTRRSARQA